MKLLLFIQKNVSVYQRRSPRSLPANVLDIRENDFELYKDMVGIYDPWKMIYHYKIHKLN